MKTIFCSIQEITLKKPNTCGASKEIIPDSFSWSINGVSKTKYTYRYSDEKFERPIKKAYKITIHQSYRENGKVRKKQYYITTVSYYSVINCGLWDCINDSIYKGITEELSIDSDALWDMIWTKFESIYNRIKDEFQQSEEYLTKLKHDEILNKYHQDKIEFAKQYECDQGEYDYCYNVFGELVNAEYLKQVEQNYKARKEYEERSYRNGQKSSYNNYSYEDGSNTTIFKSGYSEAEKAYLKRFYKMLATKFHPDANREKDTTEEMKLLNRLKDQWNV